MNMYPSLDGAIKDLARQGFVVGREYGGIAGRPTREVREAPTECVACGTRLGPGELCMRTELGGLCLEHRVSTYTVRIGAAVVTAYAWTPELLDLINAQAKFIMQGARS